MYFEKARAIVQRIFIEGIPYPSQNLLGKAAQALYKTLDDVNFDKAVQIVDKLLTMGADGITAVVDAVDGLLDNLPDANTDGILKTNSEN